MEKLYQIICSGWEYDPHKSRNADDLYEKRYELYIPAPTPNKARERFASRRKEILSDVEDVEIISVEEITSSLPEFKIRTIKIKK